MNKFTLKCRYFLKDQRLKVTIQITFCNNGTVIDSVFKWLNMIFLLALFASRAK